MQTVLLSSLPTAVSSTIQTFPSGFSWVKILVTNRWDKSTNSQDEAMALCLGSIHPYKHVQFKLLYLSLKLEKLKSQFNVRYSVKAVSQYLAAQNMDILPYSTAAIGK